MRICGYRVDGSDEDYFVLGRDHVPFVALEPDEKQFDRRETKGDAEGE